jgi:hypothetical protein
MAMAEELAEVEESVEKLAKAASAEKARMDSDTRATCNRRIQMRIRPRSSPFQISLLPGFRRTPRAELSLLSQPANTGL